MILMSTVLSCVKNKLFLLNDFLSVNFCRMRHAFKMLAICVIIMYIILCVHAIEFHYYCNNENHNMHLI